MVLSHCSLRSQGLSDRDHRSSTGNRPRHNREEIRASGSRQQSPGSLRGFASKIDTISDQYR
ncbi:hypothetical protein BF49_5703 [Bradyrhizobium sp.]|nr:hypothetical protein BF49_5703 [Bradyrhizobium sp.]